MSNATWEYFRWVCDRYFAPAQVAVESHAAVMDLSCLLSATHPLSAGHNQASILGTHTNARLSGAYPGRPPTFPALETRLTFNKVDLEKNPMEPRQQQFSLWYVLVTILAMLAIQTLFVSGHVETIPYSDFKVLLKAQGRGYW